MSPDEPCHAPGCELRVSEHSWEQAKDCAIASLEHRIADLDRSCEAERAALIRGERLLGPGAVDGADHVHRLELAFEHHMELDLLRHQLEELRAADPPVAEEGAER
jgi:hypothetical protein